MNASSNDKRNYLEWPFVGVGVVIWKESQFLLIQRGKSPHQGSWSIPGGRQNLGETLKEAASREILEETSVRINILGLVDVVDSIRKDEEGKTQFHATLVDFAARYVSGTPMASDDAISVGWFMLEDLPSLNLWDETNRIIRESTKLVGLD